MLHKLVKNTVVSGVQKPSFALFPQNVVNAEVTDAPTSMLGVSGVSVSYAFAQAP